MVATIFEKAADRKPAKKPRKVKKLHFETYVPADDDPVHQLPPRWQKIVMALRFFRDNR